MSSVNDRAAASVSTTGTWGELTPPTWPEAGWAFPTLAISSWVSTVTSRLPSPLSFGKCATISTVPRVATRSSTSDRFRLGTSRTMKWSPVDVVTCWTVPPDSPAALIFSWMTSTVSARVGAVTPGRISSAVTPAPSRAASNASRSTSANTSTVSRSGRARTRERETPSRPAATSEAMAAWLSTVTSTPSAVVPTSGARMRVPPESSRPNWRFVAPPPAAGAVPSVAPGTKRMTPESTSRTTSTRSRQFSRSLTRRAPCTTAAARG